MLFAKGLSRDGSEISEVCRLLLGLDFLPPKRRSSNGLPLAVEGRLANLFGRKVLYFIEFTASADEKNKLCSVHSLSRPQTQKCLDRKLKYLCQHNGDHIAYKEPVWKQV